MCTFHHHPRKQKHSYSYDTQPIYLWISILIVINNLIKIMKYKSEVYHALINYFCRRIKQKKNVFDSNVEIRKNRINFVIIKLTSFFVPYGSHFDGSMENSKGLQRCDLMHVQWIFIALAEWLNREQTTLFLFMHSWVSLDLFMTQANKQTSKSQH